MKDAYEVLRLKEIEMSRVETEVEALRVAAPLLSEDQDVSDDKGPASARSTELSQPIRVPAAVNANPQPVHSSEWRSNGRALP